jgi:hypothetical protein
LEKPTQPHPHVVRKSLGTTTANHPTLEKSKSLPQHTPKNSYPRPTRGHQKNQDTKPEAQAKGCIGRESNPGLADILLDPKICEMATANFTTKPPMLFYVDSCLYVQYTAWYDATEAGSEEKKRW